MKCEWTLLLYSYNFRVQIQYQHIKGFWINVFYTMLWVWLCKGFYLSKTFNQNKHRYNIHTLISSSKLPLKPHLACCPSLGAAPATRGQLRLGGISAELPKRNHWMLMCLSGSPSQDCCSGKQTKQNGVQKGYNHLHTHSLTHTTTCTRALTSHLKVDLS